MATASVTTQDFVRLLRDELGLDLEEADLDADFDQLPDWDSLHLLKLVTALEKASGRSVPVGRLLEARTLRAIHEMAGRP
jgi:acyl carrier protein